MMIVTYPRFTRAELVRDRRWPDHDPGDEDEASWLSAPVAPERSLFAFMERWYQQLAKAHADRVPFWFAKEP